MKYAALAAGVAAGDILLKRYMEQQLEWGERREICKGRILLRKDHNHGAALNILEQNPGIVKGISGGLLLGTGTIWYILMKKKKNPMLLLGLSLLIGGGASNLCDRVLKGYVVDYFSVRTPFKGLNQIIFNISDLSIFLGGLLMVFGRRGE